MIRPVQTTADIIIPVTIINVSGTNQASVAEDQFRIWVISPTGVVVDGFNGMTPSTATGNCAVITTVAAQGVYFIKFPTTAAAKAFTVNNAANPYTLIVDTVTEGVDPVAMEVWIGTQPARSGDQMILTAAYDAAKTAASQASVNLVASYVDTEVAAIKAQTDRLPVNPAAASDIPSVLATATAVWSADSRTLTSGGGSGGATAQEIWEYSARELTVRPAADYPTAITYVSGSSNPATVTWHSGKVWTYHYTSGNLTSITEV